MVTQEMIRLYDAFTHGQIPRRKFLVELVKLAGSAAAAAMILPALENNYSTTRTDETLSASLKEEYITYPAASGPMRAFSVTPDFDPPYPSVIVIHENRGLNPYIEEVARRVAMVGFRAIAPDALSPKGGTPEDSDAARKLIRELDDATTIADFVAAVAYAINEPASNGKAGCVGFCWGGRMANQLAVHCGENLQAAVAFYGRQADAIDVPRIQAALMLHYAGLDERINAGILDYEKALKEANVEYTIYQYENVNHGFHNHTSETRYNKEAATLAWQRTIAFFNVHLH